jgi:outer membrane usher protein FimD/PapC
MDYVFSSAEAVISPMRRSGTLVAFEVRRLRAVTGVLFEQRDGISVPLEFRELTLSRGNAVMRGFTARRGEFYIEDVEPGEYLLRANGGEPCSARLRVPDDAGPMTNTGTLNCVPPAR